MRRRTMILVLVLAAGLPAAWSSTAGASPTLDPGQCSRGPVNPPTAATYDLDRTAADWGVFCDRDSPTWELRNVASPALDQESLQCAMTGGDPYAALHCYRNLVSEPSANSFVFSTFFRFTPATTCNNAGSPSVVQAIEFTMGKWLAGKRWEFAVQLENVASSAGSAAPQWRWWDGSNWVAMTPRFGACLSGDTWHSLQLAGSIVDGMVRYDQLAVDGDAHLLGMTAAPVATTDGDKLAVGVQLDANSTATPYSVFLDKVSLVRQPGNFTPLGPARILDTRNGTGGIGSPLGPGSSVDVPVSGRGGVPTSGVSAVVMNVTVTEPTSAGFLTLYPSGGGRPLASNLNFGAGQTVPNLVVVRLGLGGKVGVFNSAGSTQVIFDVAGWFSTEAASAAGRYNPLVPSRMLDTRVGPGAGLTLGAGKALDLTIAGQGGVPGSGASAATLNVAVTNTTAAGYLTVYPTGGPRPVASNLNWNAGDTVSNRVMATLGTGGQVTIYNNAGSTDVVVDVGGWYTDATQPAGGSYTALAPARILDTRQSGVPVAGGTAIDVEIAGRGGVPASGASAVILNVTVTEPAGPGYLTIYPAGTSQPLASDLNYAGGETRPNLVVVKVGAGGKVRAFSQTSAHVIVDVAGWFT